MNRSELIEQIAGSTDESKAAVGRMLDAFIETVQTTLKKGGSVQLVGFGTFSTAKRAARTAKNPRTGESLKIAATTVPKFKPGQGFKDAVAPKRKK